jgi:lipoprotein-anchoring transpeptidase ErfK/SrfK
MAAAGLSLAVTMVALLGGLGVLPLQTARSSDVVGRVAAAGAADTAKSRTPADAQPTDSSGSPEQETAGSRSQDDRSFADGAASTEVAPDATDALPADSGTGRRVVFSISAQRVWLVEADGSVRATYLVSGSVTNNLAPGRYDVYSRSRRAVGVDDSGRMEYFVRFAHGRHAAIGFHSIPTKGGRPLQTEAQLGTPQSHGCIRQKLSDAVTMWDFADVGTDVVVLA